MVFLVKTCNKIFLLISCSNHRESVLIVEWLKEWFVCNSGGNVGNKYFFAVFELKSSILKKNDRLRTFCCMLYLIFSCFFRWLVKRDKLCCSLEFGIFGLAVDSGPFAPRMQWLFRPDYFGYGQLRRTFWRYCTAFCSRWTSWKLGEGALCRYYA